MYFSGVFDECLREHFQWEATDDGRAGDPPGRVRPDVPRDPLSPRPNRSMDTRGGQRVVETTHHVFSTPLTARQAGFLFPDRHEQRSQRMRHPKTNTLGLGGRPQSRDHFRAPEREVDRAAQSFPMGIAASPALGGNRWKRPVGGSTVIRDATWGAPEAHTRRRSPGPWRGVEARLALTPRGRLR